MIPKCANPAGTGGDRQRHCQGDDAADHTDPTPSKQVVAAAPKRAGLADLRAAGAARRRQQAGAR